jgi:alkanesulfonate monooxygenase SsuD/methylene tetrahydromethanopterin reductase-like flavin-dependent oxidoreductase (luciferase family)
VRFGVGLQSHIEKSWKHALLAEQMGFDSAWFVDSQLIASDVYACMALAAEHTDRIRLGTGVPITDTRIPPVIAHSIATINQLAPGRVTLGIGSGHTAWRAMGMPPMPIASFRHAVEVCRGLLAGESVEYRARGYRSEIRFMDVDNGYINVDDPIPILLAASHPRAQALAGELGDGLLTLSLLDTAILEKNLAAVAKGWSARPGGRPPGFEVVTLAVSCVLRPGEQLDSPRVIARVGPRIAGALHYAYELARQGRDVPAFVAPFLTPAYQRFLDERRDAMHATHSRVLHRGEEAFITPEAIAAMSLTGMPEALVERLRGLESSGLTELVISPPWGFVEESIVELAREVIPLCRGRPATQEATQA